MMRKKLLRVNITQKESEEIKISSNNSFFNGKHDSETETDFKFGY
jgi:hypothetical protein